MKTLLLVSILMIILGVVALAYQGITYTTTEKAVDIGPLQITAERTHHPSPANSWHHCDCRWRGFVVCLTARHLIPLGPPCSPDALLLINSRESPTPTIQANPEITIRSTTIETLMAIATSKAIGQSITIREIPDITKAARKNNCRIFCKPTVGLNDDRPSNSQSQILRN